MIPHDEDHIPTFDDAALEREWQAQESAMRRERLQLDPAGDDARSRCYRLIARSLRQPLTESLPADFAQQLAARVGAVPSPAASASASFEFKLMLVLAATMAVAAIAVIAIYGSAWLPSFAALAPNPQAPATHWLLALAGCVGASWLLGLWQQRTHRHQR
ncbi:hypothetical protein ABNK63_02470 [Rhodanobacter sp. IGA1.0]|uniref:Uncharacterized protein n=1 Tax=Rhodanobacter sp. IGA1.0 TaxID=3158582 RepID=A0AAU7QLZ5_9GAMM